ncbi:fungal pheromone mating factor STE2 GPCR-domain-containing protein [Lipomyces oligophaga]|uniref:fungal pheromone mating factor STE2 GPCR-domain-containing protein n=1 Tax=Lipomyces oligophaga TaxID=45792 RepID=UPI0034CE9DC7
MSDQLLAPMNQTFEVLMPDGSHINITWSDLDFWMRDTTIPCLVFGVHIGACTAVAIGIAILTKPGKRWTPVFILNELSLFLVALRAGLWINYALGDLNKAMPYFTYYVEDIPMGPYVESSVTSVMQVLITIAIETSLIFQVRVVFETNPHIQRRITIACVALACVVVAFWTVVVVQNVQYILAYRDLPEDAWAWTTAKVLYSFSIFVYCAIFCYKLYRSILARKVLGTHRQFGPLQVILIMGTQVMIVPLVLVIIQMSADLGPPMSSLGTLVVALSLPLSAVWASAANDTIIANRRNAANLVNYNINESMGTPNYSGQTFYKSPTSTQATCSEDFDIEGGLYDKEGVIVKRTVIST